MKKLAVILIFAMLCTLCACGGNDSQITEPSESVTQGTETNDVTEGTDATEETTEATEATTEATEATTEATEAVTDPTKETEPTVTPSAPAPTTCSHNWAKATCTAPKTCSKCGATEGSAAGHSWKNATCTAPKTCSKCGATEGSATEHTFSDGVCTACGAEAPKSAIEDFADGMWKTMVVVPAEDDYGEILLSISFRSSGDLTYGIKSYYENNPYEEQVFGQVEYNGKTYLDTSFSGSMGGFAYEETANGNVKVVMMNETEFELERVTATEFKVVACNDPVFLPIGTILTNQA